jgi:hypothetical protein
MGGYFTKFLKNGLAFWYNRHLLGELDSRSSSFHWPTLNHSSSRRVGADAPAEGMAVAVVATDRSLFEQPLLSCNQKS